MPRLHGRHFNGFLAFSLVTLAVTAANAATIRVTSLSDGFAWDGGCSLAEAVKAANTNSRQFECPKGTFEGTDTIFLPENNSISLSGLLTVSSNIEIATETYLYKRATLIGGSSGGFAIDPSAKLTFNKVRLTGFTGRTAIVMNDGTYPSNRAELFLYHSEISGNNIIFGPQTSSLLVGKAGEVTIAKSVIRNNTSNKGGALLVDGGRVTISQSVLANNTANQYGGAIHALANSTLIINNSSIVNNNTTNDDGGAIYAIDTYGYISYTTFTGNVAAKTADAIYISSSNGSEFTLTRNIIADNGDSVDADDCYETGRADFYSNGDNVLRACGGFAHTSAGDKTLTGSQSLGLAAMPATPAQWNKTPEMVPAFGSATVLVGKNCGGESSEASYDQNLAFRPADNICAAGAVDPHN